MERSPGEGGFPAGRRLAVVSTSGRTTARVDIDVLLDAAERHLTQAVLREDAYAEVLIVGTLATVRPGAAEPSVRVRFPAHFAGLPG